MFFSFIPPGHLFDHVINISGRTGVHNETTGDLVLTATDCSNVNEIDRTICAVDLGVGRAIESA